MSNSGFIIDQVSVEGPSKSNAQLDLTRGLNVVCGASDTGKTYFLQCVDFLLGASKPPKSFPENEGYVVAYLSGRTHDKKLFTLARAMSGGSLKLFSCHRDDIGEDSESVKLGARHSADDPHTASGFLLSLSGLDARWVRKNKYGQKNSLSFRDLAFLSIVDEEKIISVESPVLSGQYVSKTAEESVFQLLLTGTDDSAVVAEEKPAERRARLKAQIALVEDLIADKKRAVKKWGGDLEALRKTIEAVDADLKAASEVVASLQRDIDLLDEERQKVWHSVKEILSRRKVIEGLLGRLKLLAAHYGSDRDRLQAMLEVSGALSAEKTYACPECGRAWSEPRSDGGGGVPIAGEI